MSFLEDLPFLANAVSSIKRRRNQNKPTSSLGIPIRTCWEQCRVEELMCGCWLVQAGPAQLQALGSIHLCNGNAWDRDVSQSALHTRVWGRNNEGRGRVLEVKVTLWTLTADSSALALMLPEASVAPVTLGRGIWWEGLNLCSHHLDVIYYYILLYTKIFLVI